MDLDYFLIEMLPHPGFHKIINIISGLFFAFTRITKTIKIMKTLGLIGTVLLLITIIGATRATAQKLEAEVPGDNFSLEGALELFKKSDSPETFEKLLNSADSKVNNLDLNGDGYIDYIRVIDRNEGNIHAFILQAIISENESQDVAVIELEKLANGKAILQITGDADVFGIETIIEPTNEVRINAGTTTTRTVVNVWAWPSVQYIYSPYYTSVWISPWRWSYRPVWYRPWRPVAYYTYSPYWRPYRSYYSVCYTHRVAYAHQLYRPYRTTSVIVSNRHQERIHAYRSTRQDYDRNGHYKYADNGKRSSRSSNYSNANRYGDSRSTDRQRDTRGTANTNGRQGDSRSTYTDRNSRSTTTERSSRSSTDQRRQEPVRSDYTTRDRSSNTPVTRRSESTTTNRSTAPDRNRSTDSQRNTTTTQRSSREVGSSGNSRPQTTRPTPPSQPREQATRPTSNSGTQRQAAPRYAPAPQVERKAPASNPSREGSGNSRSEKEASKSKRGGN